MKHNIDELKWIRAFSPDVIPKYLVEQIRRRDFSVDDFYKYQNLNCLMQGSEGTILNPFNHLYVLANDKNFVKGFLWFVISPLSKEIIINTFSVDKEYWGGGAAVKKLSDHIKEILKKLQLKKVFWINTYPKHSERYGFHRSRNILMEYNLEEEQEKES